MTALASIFTTIPGIQLGGSSQARLTEVHSTATGYSTFLTGRGIHPEFEALTGGQQRDHSYLLRRLPHRLHALEDPDGHVTHVLIPHPILTRFGVQTHAIEGALYLARGDLSNKRISRIGPFFPRPDLLVGPGSEAVRFLGLSDIVTFTPDKQPKFRRTPISVSPDSRTLHEQNTDDWSTLNDAFDPTAAVGDNIDRQWFRGEQAGSNADRSLLDQG
jgi:hypothetical protein